MWRPNPIWIQLGFDYKTLDSLYYIIFCLLEALLFWLFNTQARVAAAIGSSVTVPKIGILGQLWFLKLGSLGIFGWCLVRYFGSSSTLVLKILVHLFGEVFPLVYL